MRHGLLGLVAIGLVTLAGCGEREHDRIAVAGLVQEVTDPMPQPGVQIVQLPPLPRELAEPDTADGTIFCRVDQQAFMGDYGMTLPSWTPRRHDKGDPLAPILVHVQADLAAIARLLDAVFDAAAVGAAEGNLAPRRRAAVLLSPEEWRALLTKVAALVERIDQVTRAMSGPPRYGDGETQHSERQQREWQGMDVRATAIATAVAQLGRDGFAAVILSQETDAGPVHAALAAIADGSTRFQQSVASHDAPRIVPLLRLVQRHVDLLEDQPAWIAALGRQEGLGHPTTRPQRDETRLRVVELRQALVAAAACWAGNCAALIELEERPLLVHDETHLH